MKLIYNYEYTAARAQHTPACVMRLMVDHTAPDHTLTLCTQETCPMASEPGNSLVSYIHSTISDYYVG